MKCGDVMPKKDKKEKKKAELEKLIKDIKDNAPEASRAEIEELENMLAEILEDDNRSPIKKVFGQILSFIIHTAVMYVAALLVFGFFFPALSVENKFLIFLFAGIISLVLVIFERVPRNPFREHFISINLIIFAIIVVGFCIINKDVFRVFSVSAIWIFYLVSVEAIYLLIEHTILKKIRLA